MTTSQKLPIRLALREEGAFWNAYLADSATMDGAKLIGSIMIGAVRKNPEAKAAFQALMQLILTDAIQEVTGQTPDSWNVEKAPEAERAGNA